MGRIAKWGTQLGSFDVRYRPRSSVKGQVLADFVAKFFLKNEKEMVCHVENRPLKVFVDDASSAVGANARIVIVTLEGIRLEHSFRLRFRASNNEAEYKALLAGLRAIMGIGARDVEVYLDSRLVVNQVQGSFEAQDSRMKAYLQVVKQIMNKFCTTKVAQVARAQNRHADSLATLASLMTEEVSRLIKVKLIEEPSIDVAIGVGAAGVEIAVIFATEPCWMDSIIDFLAKDGIPYDEKEANRVRRVAAWYWLSTDRKLYRRSFRGPYLLCLRPKKISELLAKLHDGVCGSHVKGRSLAHRAMTQGFWWPQMQKDAAEYVRKYEQCQKHVPLIHQPASHLNPVSNPWLFAQWGLDILCPFPWVTRNRRFVLVAVDYFTK
ncbi:uncharacterized protein LOC115959443 [Quercus lobata]|uniref:uncharacterized protein LOC115959443 n=1 Tax=Quercus lobata TaxID=97700 RepID=UPI00124739AB|nr:uncharacterized protein LOC115959443 [Quercus lobata]